MDEIVEMLSKTHTIAVVGISQDPTRPSHFVAKYLQKKGYRVIPVNPHIDETLGEIGYPDLKSVPGTVDMVNVFRRSEFVGGIVDDAIRIGAKYIWMQDGVADENAAARSREEGLMVVMNNCVMRQHRLRAAALVKE